MLGAAREQRHANARNVGVVISLGHGIEALKDVAHMLPVLHKMLLRLVEHNELQRRQKVHIALWLVSVVEHGTTNALFSSMASRRPKGEARITSLL